MIDNDFNTLSSNIESKKENTEDLKDRRKTLVVFMILIIGQIMSILNTLINNFTTQTFKHQYPILYNGGFYFIFFIIWMLINRKITEPKRYYYLIIILETQSFFFDYLSNYSYDSQIFSQNDPINNSTNNSTLNINVNNITIEENIDIKFKSSYPSYINFPIQFVLTFFLFICFMKRKYYLRKRHYFSIFLGMISVGLFTYFYYQNYFIDCLLMFKEFKTSGKVKVIIFTILSNILLSLSYIFQEHFFKSGKEIYEFFPYKAFISMIILGFESFVVGEFSFINKEIFKNKDICLNFIYFCVINSIYLSVIPFLIKHITSLFLVINYINYLFYYYFFYLSKNNFTYINGLLIISGFVLNIISFYIFVKYKAKKSYQNMKETIEKKNIGNLLHDPSKYDINSEDSKGTAHVEMNLQISNDPFDGISNKNA
jgi:hypothetical protein